MGKNDLVKKLRDSGRKDYVRLADSIEKDLDYYHDLTRDDLKGKTKIGFAKGNAAQHLDDVVDTIDNSVNWSKKINILRPFSILL